MKYTPTALPNVMRYKNPTPKPSPQTIRGLKMYLIRAETAVFIHCSLKLKNFIPQDHGNCYIKLNYKFSDLISLFRLIIFDYQQFLWIFLPKSA
jgi:hypothetical protein